MNATIEAFVPKFLQGIDPMSARLLELQELLIPGNQKTANGISELLRVTSELYQILHTRYCNFGKLPYQASVLRRFKEEIGARMSQPENLNTVLRILTADVSPDVEALRKYDPVFEDLLGAVTALTDFYVRTCQKSGRDPAAPISLVTDSSNPLYQYEKILVSRHMRGVRAQTLEGELFRAMRRLAQVIDTSDLHQEELGYELTLLLKFLREIDDACEGVDMCDLFAEINYHYSQKISLPADWSYQEDFIKAGHAVVRMVALAENLVTNSDH